MEERKPVGASVDEPGSGWTPSFETLTSLRVPVCRSLRKISVALLLSLGTRSGASLWNTTNLPSVERAFPFKVLWPVAVADRTWGLGVEARRTGLFPEVPT